MTEDNHCQQGHPNPPCDPVKSARPIGRQHCLEEPSSGRVKCARACDGSVRFISDTIVIATWRALSTSQGGETLGEY